MRIWLDRSFLVSLTPSFSAEHVNLVELKDDITDYLTTWSEWSSCSPYCKRSRFRVCTGEFGNNCFDCSTKDGDTCEAEHESCETGERCFEALHNDRLIKSESLKFCEDVPEVNLKLTGGIPENEVWPWMYEMQGLVDFKKDEYGNWIERESFCTANQIDKYTLITGKVKSIPYCELCVEIPFYLFQSCTLLWRGQIQI